MQATTETTARKPAATAATARIAATATKLMAVSYDPHPSDSVVLSSLS